MLKKKKRECGLLMKAKILFWSTFSYINYRCKSFWDQLTTHSSDYVLHWGL